MHQCFSSSNNSSPVSTMIASRSSSSSTLASRISPPPSDTVPKELLLVDGSLDRDICTPRSASGRKWCRLGGRGNDLTKPPSSNDCLLGGPEKDRLASPTRLVEGFGGFQLGETLLCKSTILLCPVSEFAFNTACFRFPAISFPAVMVASFSL